MTSQLIPSLIVDPCAVVRKERELPVVGELLCQVGDQVASNSIVARAMLAGDLVILKVAEKLGIEAFEVQRGLRVSVGEEVLEDQLLCEHCGVFGLFKSRYRSPAAGTVEFLSEATGHLGLRLPAKMLQVNAYLAGKVMDVKEKKSVTIESNAVLVQGIFGVGGERLGSLSVIKHDFVKDLTVADLPLDLSGKVVVVSGWVGAEVLHAAAARGAQGFILSSIEDNHLSNYLGYDVGIALTGNEKISMSVIVTEGFGRLKMALKTWSIFKELSGSPAAINGTTQVRAGAIRPEIVVFANNKRLDDFKGGGLDNSFAVGGKIRIIRAPFFGEIATIQEIPDKPQPIGTGALTRVLQVKLADGSEVVVPRANIELL